jgi:putative membrane protein
VLTVAFVTPFCAMTSALFSARAAHHLVVIAVAAPLIASAMADRLRVGLAATFIAATVTLWAWHVPAFYTAALTETWLYWLMQLTLLGTATLFWHALFTAPAPQALIAIAATIGQMGLLGALLTFAPEPMYLHHMVAPVAWGLTPLGDQQLAGLIMWVPGNIPYAILGWLIARRMWRMQEAAA